METHFQRSGTYWIFKNHYLHHQKCFFFNLADAGKRCAILCWFDWCKHSHRKSNKIQQCIKILFHIYMKLNIFRATHRPSSGANISLLNHCTYS